MKRRHFLKSAAAVTLAATSLSLRAARPAPNAPRYRLSLGQWTFNHSFRGDPGYTKRDTLEFPTMAGELGFEGVDYSGLLLGENHAKPDYLKELNRRAADAGVKNVLILVDLYDPLGAPTEEGRRKSVEKFRPWVAAAASLGCSGIRVNARSDAKLPADEQAKWVADGINLLLTVSAPLGIDVLIENHGQGIYCDGNWISSIVRQVGNSRCGTLPDFGNFQKNRDLGEYHDRYDGVAAMLPFAKCVCAKAHDFDQDGEECYTNYDRMLRLVSESGFRGWIEVEYEGPGNKTRTPTPVRTPGPPLGEREGALATQRLLRKHLGAALRIKA